MNSLEIKSDHVRTIDVKFLPDGKLSIEGASCEEDPKPLYNKLIQWIKEYSAQPASSTELNICLKYFNSSSAKCILELLSIVTSLAKNTNLRIIWSYEKEDEDMLDAIDTFAELVNFKIEAVAIDSY